MLFDTDVLIWIEKGNKKAAQLVTKADRRFISAQTFMELIQCAKNKEQVHRTKDFLSQLSFQILPFTENIGHRAMIYIEEYSLSTGIRAGDAVIAATATENDLTLATGNSKHFNKIQNLKFIAFKPTL